MTVLHDQNLHFINDLVTLDCWGRPARVWSTLHQDAAISDMIVAFLNSNDANGDYCQMCLVSSRVSPWVLPPIVCCICIYVSLSIVNLLANLMHQHCSSCPIISELMDWHSLTHKLTANDWHSLQAVKKKKKITWAHEGDLYHYAGEHLRASFASAWKSKVWYIFNRLCKTFLG